jgi:hypothetical protein
MQIDDGQLFPFHAFAPGEVGHNVLVERIELLVVPLLLRPFLTPVTGEAGEGHDGDILLREKVLPFHVGNAVVQLVVALEFLVQIEQDSPVFDFLQGEYVRLDFADDFGNAGQLPVPVLAAGGGLFFGQFGAVVTGYWSKNHSRFQVAMVSFWGNSSAVVEPASAVARTKIPQEMAVGSFMRHQCVR